MKDTDFVYVNPVYTGGGIYCYTGLLKNGNYFLASDADNWIVEVNENPDETEDAWQMEWIEPHKVRDIDFKNMKGFFKAMLRWVIKNQPSGKATNYSIGDMEDLLENIDEWCVL